MPGPLRPMDVGLIYHVIHRSNNRQEVYHEPEDFFRKEMTRPLRSPNETNRKTSCCCTAVGSSFLFWRLSCFIN